MLLPYLASRKIEAQSGIVIIAEEGWQVFEYQDRCLAIDPSAGLWIGPSGGEWEHLGACTVSGALQAVEFLAK